ncbi:MAG: DNA translocase FtsK 4TM domain-containing protein [Magnetococcales bacterium]|nr:DNA translocase FtsK 4TM domain-containing protein [Magnetococcales bacterium]
MANRVKPQPAQKPQNGSAWPRTLLYEGLGIVSISAAVFLLLTLLSFHPDDPSFNQTGGQTIHNAAGLFGAYLSDALFQLLGYAAGGFVLFFGMAGMQLFRNAMAAYWDRLLAVILLMVAAAVLSALFAGQGEGGMLPAGPGGLIGSLGAERIHRALGPVGSLVLLVPLIVLGLMVLIRFSLMDYWQSWGGYWQRFKTWYANRNTASGSAAEPATPKPESRAEAKKRLAAEAKKAAAAEAGMRAEMEAKRRAAEAVEPTLIGAADEQIEADLLVEPREIKKTKTGIDWVGQMRRGLVVSAQWTRRLSALIWQRLKQIKWPVRAASDVAKPVADEAEPEFYPAPSEGFREPVFDEFAATGERAVVYNVAGRWEWEEGGERPLPVAEPPGSPAVSQPPLPSPVAQAAVLAPEERGKGVVPPRMEGRPVLDKAQESSWRPNPVELWPESPGKPLPAPLVVADEEREPPVLPTTLGRDLPSFELFPQPVEDRQDLLRGMERVWQEDPSAENSELPPFSLMVDPGPKRSGGPSREALNVIARILEQKLADFKIKGQIVDVLPGPVVTTFELDLAPGLRAAKVIGLSDDLARSISVSSVRVVGNVPGKTVIGIEIPNEVRQTVYLKEILTSEAFRKIGSPLAVALGSDIFGNPVAGNLAKMPHLLVAGTTGSGKSVAVNAMICSILFSARPDEVRFLMVDPKMLELSIYEGIPHLLAPVVTDVNKAANLLKWAVAEMENRYRLMSELGVRNLTGFNERIQQCIEQDEQPTRRVKIGVDPETGRVVEQDEPIPLDTKPLVVIVIDELADLMIQVGKEVEPAIARLAQMARAAGLHLILATQRPSVDVITGLIKANFPTRLAFQVSSKIDSRTILDAMGADRLLGMGDGLFLPPGTSHLQRIHAPFVSDKEVHDLVKYLRSTGTPDYDHSVLMQRGEGDEGDEAGFMGGSGGEEQDELYDQAANVVIRARKVSTSMVQRHFKIGYNRAARMVERMEAEGLVSAPNGAGKREVLAPEP